MNTFLNKVIDDFIYIHTTNNKQHSEDWNTLFGTTIGGSEISTLLNINPFTNIYQLIESKINICKGINKITEPSCYWGNIFEYVIRRIVEIDLENKVKGYDICIQKYEGHRNSPDGYMVIHLYKKDDTFHIWTSDLNKDIIDTSIIVLLEFKCPITRKVTNNIPKHYVPQILSGLSVSPLAVKGLFIDALFRKCSVNQLHYDYTYDTSFHKQIIKNLPIAYGIIPIYFYIDNNIALYKINKNLIDINSNDVIDLGIVSTEIFFHVLYLIHEKVFFNTTGTVQFFDRDIENNNIIKNNIRGDKDIFSFNDNISNSKLIAILPWKLFDLLYYFIDREANFLENLLPNIQNIIKKINDYKDKNYSDIELKMLDMCELIYSNE